MIYPWQRKQWQQFLAAKEKGRVPSALLLSGARGLGQLAFAQAIAQHLLGINEKNLAMLQSGNHPDLYFLSPEEGKNQIRIDAVRDVIECVQQSSAHYRVVIIEPSESLNTAASNALLKTLEEPTKNTLFLLVSYAPQSILPTVRSRCQHYVFQSNYSKETQDWLASQLLEAEPVQALLRMSEGAPLLALEQANLLQKQRELFKCFIPFLRQQASVFDFIDEIKKNGYDLSWVLRYLSLWFLEIYRLQRGITITDTDEKYQKMFTHLANLLEKSPIFAIVRALNKLREQSQQFSGLNAGNQLAAILLNLHTKESP